MADEIEGQVAAHIRELLRLALDVKGMTLRKLNELAGQTIQNYNVEMGLGEHSSVPICVQFTPLRRSGRQSRKRDYKKMQGPSAVTGRLAKKPKPPDDKCLTDDLPTDDSFEEHAGDGSTGETPTEIHNEHHREHPSETSTNASATGTPATSESTIGRSSTNCPDTAQGLDPSGTDDLPTSATHIQIEGDERVDDMSPTTHRAGYEILNEFFGQPAIGLEAVSDTEEHGKWPESTHRDEDPEHTGPSNTPKALDVSQHAPSTGINAVSSEDSDILEPDLFVASATTSESSSRGSSEPGSLSTGSTSASSETRIHDEFPSGVYSTYVKRSFLDDPAPWLEHVLTTLETDDTSRRPNPVLGVLDEVLTNGNFTLCVRIMTSIAENWVKCNRCIVKPTFDAVQERSREVEGNKIGLHVRRLTSECVSRQQNQKGSQEEIARLDMRELAEMEMQKLLSEPKELTGEFKEESDYETVIKHIEKGNADDTRMQLRRLWKEAYYWPMI